MTISIELADSAGTQTATFFSRSVRYDKTQNRVVMIGANVSDYDSIKEYSATPPHTIVSETLFVNTLGDSAADDTFLPLKLSNHAIMQATAVGVTTGSGGGSIPVIKVDRATGIITHVFGEGSGTASYGPTRCAMLLGSNLSEAFDSSGAGYVMFVSDQEPGCLVIKTADMTYQGHNTTDFTNFLGDAYYVTAAPFDPVTGYPRWWVGRTNNLGSTLHSISRVTGAPTTVTVETLFSGTSTDFLNTYGFAIVGDYLGIVDDSPNDILTLLYSANPDDRIVGIRASSVTTVLHNTDLGFGVANLQYDYNGFRVENKTIGVVSGVGGTNALIKLINTETGATIDSDTLPVPSNDPIISSKWWDGVRGRGFSVMSNASIPFFSYSSTLYDLDPAPPPALPGPPTPGVDDGAFILRGNDITAVMNNFGQFMEDELQRYMDKGGSLAFGQSLGVNGQRITGLSDGIVSLDLVTLSQFQDLLP